MYKNLIDLLREDSEFGELLESLFYFYDDHGCINIKSVEEVKSNGERVNILNENFE